jgi:xylulokinase
VPVNSIRVSGGGARSAFWRQMLADVFGRPVVMLETEEGSAYGAALLALVGTGQYASIRELAAVAIRETAAVDPAPGASAIYAEGHKTYKALYPALKSVGGVLI